MDKVKIYNLIDSLNEIQHEMPEILAEKVMDGISDFLEPAAVYIKLRMPDSDQIEKFSGQKAHQKLLQDYEKKLITLEVDSAEFVSDRREKEIIVCAVLRYPEGCSGILMAIINRTHALKHIARQIIELFKNSISLALTMHVARRPFDLDTFSGRVFPGISRVGVEGLLLIDLMDSENGYWVDKAGTNKIKLTGTLEELPEKKDGMIDKRSITRISNDLPSSRKYDQLMLDRFEVANHSIKVMFAGSFKNNDVVISKFKSLLADMEHPGSYNEVLDAFKRLKEDHKLIVKGERVAAILETAVAVNHEINNPLTAVLGNTQLLLLKKDSLPDDIVSKIKTIEKSAIRIREVTQKLMTIVEPVTTSYTDNLEMLDIDKSSSEKGE